MVAVLSRSGTLMSDLSPESMPASGACVANKLYSGLSVAIVTDDTHDFARVSRLLRNAGFNGSDINLVRPCQMPELQAFAAVLCHRHTRSLSEFIPPEGMKVSRVIIISDCMREESAVRFLNAGARHFFSLNDSDLILQERLEAGLRMHRRVYQRSFSEGDIRFDVQKRKVSRAGLPVDLSPKEFEFARHLFSRVDDVVSNTELMTSVWSLPSHMDTRRIDTAACRVRKKLRLCPEDGWELKKIRCVGYRLTRMEKRLELVDKVHQACDSELL